MSRYAIPTPDTRMANLNRNCRPAPLTGVVLAGGTGTRLGRNKSSMRLACKDGEWDILARNMALLGKLCDKSIVVGRHIAGYECLEDALPGKGPMGGIATALSHGGGPCLVVSCDLPFMEKGILERLITAHRNRPRTALCTSYRSGESGRIEALVAVYEQETLPLFRDCLDKNLLKISLTVPLHQQYFVPYTAKESRCFFNINYPDDLEAAERMLAAMEEHHEPG